MPSFRINIASMRLFKRRHKSGLEVWFIEISRGKRYSTGCVVGVDDAEAETLFEKVKKDAKKGKLAHLYDEPSPMLLADFAKEYIEHGRRLNKSPFSLRKDEQTLRYFLNFAGGQVHLADINRRLVESWLASLNMKPVSRNTYFRHFKAALGKAVDWDYLKKNPCRGIKQIRDDELPPRALTPDEIGRLLAAEPDQDFQILWQFLLATGARRTEALQIKAEDVDRDHGLILLRRTKSRRSRHLLITPEIAAILDKIPVQVGKLWPWMPDTVTHHFLRTARAAGVDCRLHDLRHTYGTRLATQVAPWILKELMGHSDLKTTQRYIHLTPTDLAKEMK